MEPGQGRGRRIEVLFADVDRRVAVDVAADQSDDAATEIADDLVRALITDDPDEAERGLTADVGTRATVHRVG